MQTDAATDTLKIGKYEFRSRLFVGTGKYPSLEIMQEAHEVSGAEVVTVAIRRMHLDDASGKTLVDYIDRKHMTPADTADLLKEVGKRSIRLGSELTGKVSTSTHHGPGDTR